MSDCKKKPILISDTTFRDAHQSIFATRLRIEDMEFLAEDMNKAGFYSMEVWGGATFDVCTRYLNEDPWENAIKLRKLLPDVKLTMLLRGQNLVGYRHYADDVVDAFVEEAAAVGIDIFRVFDALNDPRNCMASYKAVKKVGKHVQGAISYTITEKRLGGAIYNIDYFVNKAKQFVDMGADSICIKDMAGMLSPYDAYELVSALKQNLDVPIQLHTHYTSGMGSMTLLKAIEAGVDIVDTALSPFALRTAQPAVEPIVASLAGTDRDTGLDLGHLLNTAAKLESIAPKYRKFLNTTKTSVIDTGVLTHQVPGGMLSNLVSQLREAQALDRLPEVLTELPKTRADLGYPPLVTPTSQMVGIQSVQNVLFGRYKIISAQVKDYIYGLYGAAPAPINPELQAKALKGYPRGEEPITCRPADLLEPELEQAAKSVGELAKDRRDLLTYAMYPVTGLKFLKWKYGLEAPPKEVLPITLEDVKAEDELIKKALNGELEDKRPPIVKGENMREFNIFVNDTPYKVEVEEVGGAPVIRKAVQFAPRKAVEQKPKPAAKPAAPVPKVEPKPAPKPEKPAAAPAAPTDGTPVLAPMPGIMIRYEKQIGDHVEKDEPIATIEAMKMQMAVNSPVSGTVKELKFGQGDSVDKNAVLAIVAG